MIRPIPFILCCIAATPALLCQTPERPAPLEPLQALIGRWEGRETGQSGAGKGQRTYRLILGGRYLQSQNISRFEPQEKNPQGETHEDWTFFSYDRARKRIVVRQFNIEGFVNQFVHEPAAGGGQTFVFVSESTENAPAGMRARLTYELKSRDAFEEVFELALPGKEFEVYMRNHWQRVE